MSIPSIPDTLAKLMILVSFLIFGFALYEFSQDYSSKLLLDQQTSSLSDSLTMDSIRVSHLKNNLLDDVRNELLTCVTCKNEQIPDSDILNGKVLLSHPNAYLLIRTYKNDRFNIDQHIPIDRNTLNRINKTLSKIRTESKLLALLSILATVMFSLAMWALQRNEIIARNFVARKILDKPIYHWNCQSCAKTFSSVTRYGTESNGNINYSFCNSCYSNGSFVEQVSLIEFLRNKEPEFRLYKKTERWRIIKRIKRADRWTLPYRQEPD